MASGGAGGAKRSADEAAQEEPAASHHKYCHFCQHVKIRSSSMLGCQNPSCMRRFCRHCLLTHLGEEDEMLDGSDAQPWYCPICRSKCCCAKSECTEEHRHCKAYRYRCSRAEKSIKGANGNKKKRTVSTKRGPCAPSSTGSVGGLPRGGGGMRLPRSMADEAAHADAQDLWNAMLKPEDDINARILRPEDESSPPPLMVYESGAESAQLHQGYASGCDFDAFQSQMDDDDEGVDERVMTQLLGRMHNIQPRWLKETDDTNELEWLRQSYLLVYQQPPQVEGELGGGMQP